MYSSANAHLSKLRERKLFPGVLSLPTQGAHTYIPEDKVKGPFSSTMERQDFPHRSSCII
jgi:hypothetical protein